MTAVPLRRRWATGAGTLPARMGRLGPIIALGALGLLTLVAALGPTLSPYDPIQPVGPPSKGIGTDGHLLGTDIIGRDLLSRTLHGVQTSWFTALVVVAIGLFVGAVVGLIAGASGGWVDALLMRMTDLFLALPSAVVTIAIVAALGPSLKNTLIGVSVVWWPYYARIIRGEVRAIASRPHVEAARLAGVGTTRLLTRHILPGVVPTAIVAASLDVGNVILLLAGLSFLGLGQPQPTPELGSDTARGAQFLLSTWWVPVVPGTAVLVLSLVANLGGDGLRTWLARRR